MNRPNYDMEKLPKEWSEYTKHKRQVIDGYWVGHVYEDNETTDCFACYNDGGCKFRFVRVEYTGRNNDWSTTERG
jgi:hypothetical protein